LHEINISCTLLNYPKIKRFAAIKDTFAKCFSKKPVMNLAKVVFFVCFCLLFAVKGKGSTTFCNLSEREYNVIQSPLSDDETDSSNLCLHVLAELSCEETDENFSSELVTKVISLEKSKVHFISERSNCKKNNSNQSLYVSAKQFSPSYLQVFRT
jgi:hypothetical protein